MKRIILILLALLALPSCSTMTPAQQALLIDAAGRIVNIGIDRLSTKHPQK